MKIQVASVQFQPQLNRVAFNLRAMAKWVNRIKSEQIDIKLIVFPELSTTGYECGTGFYQLAETVTGQSVQYMQNVAKRYHVYLIFGFAQRDQTNAGTIYNSTMLINDQGQIVGTYQKVHLFDTEQRYFTPGKTYPVFKTKIGTIGMMICYDTFFPEVARILALEHADLLTISTNWERPRIQDWELCVRARALDNIIPIVAANRIGFDKELDFFGHSKIIDPLGTVMSSLDSERPGYLQATIDYEQTRGLRHGYYSIYQDAHPETYSEKWHLQGNMDSKDPKTAVVKAEDAN
ncbi:carbon-nitrogen hydrolase family protein [Lentilactobacillus hilgardii]|uniref:Carbon-nitrogen hydrolase family protein n=1 Tax=Lentilactobacillus hilgardii TaxID=1588 RepID=A0A6P1E8F4_LENHI|nr:carbon-nitrogen hydrolase family protein [Lentilactobacillus hilgardii]MCI2019581.1 carbon-nitrogen hydrolase family protein [Lentilactobacillus buchneri]RRG12272.1 MAG: carbon-nitrogen hydrolase family protein [Lactobacillus sp.]EEI71561.1 hydrolase, carbon-nitrogen family [Lentilactobacillus hilgardii ATCC 27305]MCT3392708.1 carbon-nitrogen hydrolase family protein [Lentilactobacillus hilgardii]QHB51521.1 carbon-nitrogen hydrolase family protein [Lentilactobacillus hilgardii]